MSEPFLLGIDNGGTATKVAVFSLDGREISSAGVPVQILPSPAGHSERDMVRLWQDTATVIRTVLERAAIPGEAIVAVSCTGHGNGLYLVDADGGSVRPAINSNDIRAQAYVDSWRKCGVEASVRQFTGQSLWAGQPPALLAWLRAHEPERLKKARWILMCKDYIRFRLTQVVSGEITDFSGCSLMDLAQDTVDDHILRAFGLEEYRNLIPELRASAEIGGYVTEQASQETGLRKGTPVACGMFDIDACCLGSGVIGESIAAVVAGTWGNNLAVSEKPVTDGSVFMSSRFAVHGKMLLLEGSPTSAGNLDWAIRTLGVSSYREAEVEAAHSTSEVFFLPFLYGSNAHPLARSAFVGMSLHTTRADLLRAVYEGICFAHRVHLERLLGQRTASTMVRLSGGPARSSFWGQMFANCLNLSVEVVEGEELGAKGAAMAAGLAANIFQDYEQAVSMWVRVRQQFLPQEGDKYERKYQDYRAVASAMDEAWPALRGSHV